MFNFFRNFLKFESDIHLKIFLKSRKYYFFTYIVHLMDTIIQVKQILLTMQISWNNIS